MLVYVNAIAVVIYIFCKCKNVYNIFHHKLNCTLFLVVLVDGSVVNQMCFQVAEQASGQKTDERFGLGDRKQEFPLRRPAGNSESAEPFSTRLARSVS